MRESKACRVPASPQSSTDIKVATASFVLASKDKQDIILNLSFRMWGLKERQSINIAVPIPYNVLELYAFTGRSTLLMDHRCVGLFPDIQFLCTSIHTHNTHNTHNHTQICNKLQSLIHQYNVTRYGFMYILSIHLPCLACLYVQNLFYNQYHIYLLKKTNTFVCVTWFVLVGIGQWPKTWSEYFSDVLIINTHS